MWDALLPFLFLPPAAYDYSSAALFCISLDFNEDSFLESYRSKWSSSANSVKACPFILFSESVRDTLISQLKYSANQGDADAIDALINLFYVPDLDASLYKPQLTEMAENGQINASYLLYKTFKEKKYLEELAKNDDKARKMLIRIDNNFYYNPMRINEALLRFDIAAKAYADKEFETSYRLLEDGLISDYLTIRNKYSDFIHNHSEVYNAALNTFSPSALRETRKLYPRYEHAKKIELKRLYIYEKIATEEDFALAKANYEMVFDESGWFIEK